MISLKLMADGVLRGAGAMKSFMIATFSDLLLRVILAFILAGPFGTLGIWLSWPIGWMVAMVLSLSFYKKVSGRAVRLRTAQRIWRRLRSWRQKERLCSWKRKTPEIL